MDLAALELGPVLLRLLEARHAPLELRARLLALPALEEERRPQAHADAAGRRRPGQVLAPQQLQPEGGDADARRVEEPRRVRAQKQKVHAHLLPEVVLDHDDGLRPGRVAGRQPAVLDRLQFVVVVQRVDREARAPRQQLLELQVAAALLRVRLHDALDELEAVDGPEDAVRGRVRHVDRRVLQVRPFVELAVDKPFIGVVRLALRVDDGVVLLALDVLAGLVLARQEPARAPRVPLPLAVRLLPAFLDARDDLRLVQQKGVAHLGRLVLEPVRAAPYLTKDLVVGVTLVELRLEAARLEALDDAPQREPPLVVRHVVVGAAHGEDHDPVPAPVLALPKVLEERVGLDVLRSRLHLRPGHAQQELEAEHEHAEHGEVDQHLEVVPRRVVVAALEAQRVDAVVVRGGHGMQRRAAPPRRLLRFRAPLARRWASGLPGTSPSRRGHAAASNCF